MPLRFGLAVIRSVAMLRPVVAWPSAYLSATSLRPGYFAAELFGEALLALFERAGARCVGDQGDVALDLAAVGGADGGCEAVGGDAAALHVVGGQERGEGLGVGAGVDADDLDLGSGFIDRLAKRLELGRRDDDGGRVAGDGVLEDRDLAVDVGFSLGAEFRHVDAEILAGLAGAGQNDLPVEGRGVLDDDRNGHVRRRNRRRMHDAGEHRSCCQRHDGAAVENAGHEFH